MSSPPPFPQSAGPPAAPTAMLTSLLSALLSPLRSSPATHSPDPADIVLVAHSYGGIVASMAALGLLKRDRAAQGLKGGITTCVYLCALAASVGVSLVDATGGRLPPWVRPWPQLPPDEYWHYDAHGMATFDKPEDVFYHEMSAEGGARHVKMLKLHSLGTFLTKATYAVWKEVPCWYLVCEGERAIPVQAQDGMVMQEGARWREAWIGSRGGKRA